VDGADYIGVGAVYPTTTKVVTRNIGVEGLREVRECGINIPVVAIGGIAGEDRVSDCLLKGNAHGIAVVTAIFGHHDVQSAANSLANDVRKVLASKNKNA
jgi:thiamine-phosphate pyrophosphorylase